MDIEPLAEIIAYPRTKNGVDTKVSREALLLDLSYLYQDLFPAADTTEHAQPTPWDLIEEELPETDRRYKVFAAALAAADPLAVPLLF